MQVTKKLHLQGNETTWKRFINYDYNIRGWLTSINSDLSKFSLSYNNTEEGGTPQFNGNISEILYSYPDYQGVYMYGYDGINRLTIAEHKGDALSTSYSYDKNGNIETLTREGIDNLTYTYKGNQLMSVDDQEGNEFQNNGFSDNGSFEPIEYVYDNNGNMNYDLNKNILDINYNYLNLPDNVSIIVNSDFNNILYQYDAIGSKRVKQTRVNGQIIKTTNYIGNFVYENGELAYILTSEGRIKYADSLTFYPKTKQSRNMVYQYFIKDHLGNTRIMFDEDGVKQSVNYYPFGMRTAEINQII